MERDITTPGHNVIKLGLADKKRYRSVLKEDLVVSTDPSVLFRIFAVLTLILLQSYLSKLEIIPSNNGDAARQ
jgi:hypothetical protein